VDSPPPPLACLPCGLDGRAWAWPRSLELVAIKGRKAGLRPRPLRQESVAPGDRILSHIPGALVPTGKGGGRAGVPIQAPGNVGTNVLPAPSPAACEVGGCLCPALCLF
jgi:hypothetical protein